MPTDAPTQLDTEDLPAEFFLEGPVPGGEELLLRTVAKVRRQSARSARTRGALFVTAVLATCAGLTGTGVIVGGLISDKPVAVAESSYTTTDLRTGAHLGATMAPAADGTHLAVTVTGLPVGTGCQLTVIGKDGHRLPNGSWRIPKDAGHKPVYTTVWMTEQQLAEIDVSTTTGTTLAIHMG